MAELARVEAGEPGFGAHIDMDALPRMAASLWRLIEDPARVSRPGRLLAFARRAMPAMPSSAFALAQPEVVP
jgi:hypothetical protein